MAAPFRSHSKERQRHMVIPTRHSFHCLPISPSEMSKGETNKKLRVHEAG